MYMLFEEQKREKFWLKFVSTLVAAPKFFVPKTLVCLTR
jgi:hypothetical protein